MPKSSRPKEKNKEKTVELNKASFLLLIVLAVVGLYSVYTLSKEALTKEKVLVEDRVSLGDVVVINFISRLSNGTIVDTSYENVATAEGINTSNGYGPIVFTVGEGQILEGIEDAVIGMAKGEKKVITLTPEMGFGEYNSNLIQPVPKVYSVNRSSQIPLESFQSVVSENPIPNSMLVDPNIPWPMFILNVTDDYVSFLYSPEKGSTFNTSFSLATVIELTEDKVWVRENPLDDSFVDTPMGVARVVDYNETTFLLDYNNPMAGKTLFYEVTVEGIVKAKQNQ